MNMRVIFVAAALCVVAPRARAATEPTYTLKSEAGGFFDDPMALSQDGSHLAYLVTDGATKSELFVQGAAGTPAESWGATPSEVQRISWLSPERLLIVWREGDFERAEILTAKKKEKLSLGPAGSIQVATLDGKPAITTYTFTDTKKLREHTIVAYDGVRLNVLWRRSYKEDNEGRLEHPAGPFKPLWWENGNTILAALKPGEYDATSDIRTPDRFVHFDLAVSKVKDREPIGDMIAFLRVSKEHADPKRTIASLNDDHTRLVVTDGLAEHDIKLGRPLWLYDAESVRAQTSAPGHALVSMMTDPVNPDAVKRQKVDPDFLEVYDVTRATGDATLKFQLLGEGRSLTWVAAGGKIAVLRKSKGFDRGGVEISVYDLNVP